MNKKILIIIGTILLILFASFLMIKNRNLWKYTEKSQNLCNSVPAQYKTRCEQGNAWLDQKLVEWRPQTYKPMLFGSRISMASYPNPSLMIDYYNDIVLKDLELQIETGADIITIEWYYSLSTLEKNNDLLDAYDKLMNEIKKRNKKIMIADSSEESNLTWNEWKQKYKSQVKFLTERWKPDYYVVVFEPDNYMGRFTSTPVKPRFTDPESATTEEWVDFTKELVKAVKDTNPNTRTAIALSSPGFYEPYLNYDPRKYFIESAKIDGLDILGFDIFLGPNPENAFRQVEDLISKTKSSGKEHWVIGTWGPIEQAGSILGKARETIDAKFLKLVHYFAQNNGFGGVGDIFGTHLFISYNLSKSSAEVKKFYDKGARTQPFYVYKSIIEEVKNNTK